MSKRFPQSFQVGLAAGFLTVAMVGSLVIPPSTRAFNSENFSIQSSFQSFTDGVSNTFQRMYLRLPGQKSGKVVLKQSLEATSELSSFELAMATQADATDASGASLGQFSFVAEGPVEVTDVYDPSTVQQDMKISIGFQVEGTTLETEFDLKQTPEMTYIRLNQVPAIPGMDLRELKGQWISIPSNTSQQMTGEPEVADDELTDAERRELELATRELLESAEISPARRESKDGADVFVITIELADQDIMTWLERVSEIEADEPTTPEEKEEMAEFFEKLSPIQAEVWVDASSLYLRHVGLPLTADISSTDDDSAMEDEDATGASALSSVESLGVADLSDATSLSIDFTIDFSAFNEPVSFEVPSDAKPFMEVLTTVMPGLSGVGMQGSAAPAMPSGYDSSNTAAFSFSAPESPRPAELPELTAEEAAMLREYGVEL